MGSYIHNLLYVRVFRDFTYASSICKVINGFPILIPYHLFVKMYMGLLHLYPLNVRVSMEFLYLYPLYDM